MTAIILAERSDRTPVTTAAQQEFQTKALPLADEVYGVALRMTRNPQAAEDLVAEAYARAWKNIEHFQPGTNIRAWLYKIMTNIFINRYRKTTREPKKVSFDAYDRIEDFHFFNHISSQAALANPADPFQSTVDKLTNDQFQAALDNLPAEYKAAILLYDLQGLSYQETADALDIPIGTVRSRLARGRKILQTALLENAKDAGIVPANRAKEELKG
jgi:RNA polymerase sigma-70 factor (ECF subfamily)